MTWFHGKAFAGCVLLLALLAPAVPGQQKKPAAKEIDAATVAAYEKLGAVYGGWVKWDNAPASFVPNNERAESDYPAPMLPGFRFRTFPTANLPRVAVPFGLDLADSNATNADLEKMNALDNLIILDLRDSRVTGAGLKGLAPFDRLSTLHLAYGQANAAGIKHLVGLKGLVSLDVWNVSLDKAAFKALGELKNLRELRQLGGGCAQSEWIKELAGLKKLNTLDLEGWSLSLDAVSEIGLLHALPNAAGKNGARPKSADEVVSLLTGGQLKPADLARIGLFKNLTSLQLRGVNFSPPWAGEKDPTYKTLSALLRDVARFEKLAELRFDESYDVTGVGLSELGKFKDLVSLSLRKTGLTPAGIRELATLQNLAVLDLGETPIMDADLRKLADLKKLTSLNLNSTRPL